MPSHRRTLFLPDLAEDCTNESIHSIFAPYGEIIEIKLKVDEQGHCTGVLRYMESKCAQAAKHALSGQLIGGRKMRILWVNKVQGNETKLFEDMASAQVHVSFVSRQMDFIVTEQSLRSLFSTFGDVLKVEIKQAQVKEGLEADQTQSGYGFVHFPNTPAGIESAVRAVHTYQRQTVDRVAYDCNLSHRLQSMLDAQKAKLEGYVEIVDDVRSNALPSSPAHAQQHLHMQHVQQQHPYHQQSPHTQMYPSPQQQPQQFHPPPQRYSTPGTPRMSGTTVSSGSNSARSSFTEGRGGAAGGVPGRSISRDELNVNLPNSPYGTMRQLPSAGAQHGGATPGAGGYSGAGGGVGNSGAGAGGVAGGGPYSEERLSSSSGESFRSSRSLEYLPSPSMQQQQGAHPQHPQHLLYRNASFPSPHVPYHPGTPTAGYTYPPHGQYHDEVYHQQQQRQQHLAQGGYMMPYGGHPAPPQQQQGYDDGSGRLHYVDQQQYVYSMNMSPGMMYVPEVVHQRYIPDTTQGHMRNQQQHQQQSQAPQPYSPHGVMSQPYMIQQIPGQPQPAQQHRSGGGGGGGGGYGSVRSPPAPYGGMNFNNIQPRYLGGGGGGGGSGGGGGGNGGSTRPGQYHPRARQANSSLRTFDSSPREGAGGGANSPYGGSQGGTTVSTSGRGYASYPQSPASPAAPGDMYTSHSSTTITTGASSSSSSGEAVAAESCPVNDSATDVCTTVDEVVEGLSTASIADAREEDAPIQKIGPS